MADTPASLELLRGPAVVIGVVMSISWPYISTWSATFFLQCLFASVGILMFLVDFGVFLNERIRVGLSKFLDGIVLDDILRSLHDPEIGIIPCMVGSFVGASSMYTLRMDDEQRTELVQASLWTTQEETRSILFRAGGCKALLPGPVQEWLGKSTLSDKAGNFSEDEIVVETVDTSSDSSLSEYQQGDHDFDLGTPTRRDPINCCLENGELHEVEHSTPEAEPRQTKSPIQDTGIRLPQEIPPDPLSVMFRIVKGMVFEQIKPHFASIPESTIEIIGTTAAAVFFAQMGFRFQSKSTMLSTISGVLLSGVATSAFSTVLAKHAILGTISDMGSLKLVSEAIAWRVMERVKRAVVRNGRWKATVAMMVLLLVGKRQLPVHTTTRRRRTRDVRS